MENFGQKLEEIKQQQKRSQEVSQVKIEASTARKKSPYILALGGVAAGLAIAVILLLAKIIVDKDNANTIAPNSAEAIHSIEIKKLSHEIARLDERVELITESISSLETMLMRVLELTDSIPDDEKKHTSSTGQYKPESAEAESAFDMKDSDASEVLHVTPEAVKLLVPTHVIKARLNLRPSSSLNTTPIAVLEAGSAVEFIREADGWYYVDTPLHGKGWCSSEYLSPLSPMQQKETAN